MEKSENTTPQIKSTRGKGFPGLSLPEAVKIVKSAGQVSRSLTLDSLASYANHSTPNSGAFRAKLSALRDWGFVTKTGDLSLTDLAMTIALPQSDEEEQQALRDAFLGFDLFGTFYKDSAKNVELIRNNMANSAVHTYGVGIPSKTAFIKSFVTSAISVELAEAIGKDKVVLKPMAVNRETGDTKEGQVARTPSTSTQPVSAAQSFTAPVMQQSWDHANGKVHLVIESTSPLSLEVFQQLPKVIGSVQELIQVLGPKDDSNGVSE
ncbi:MAG: hypothetical protein ABIP50_00520 [Candidatus Saccharimonadales bacterium]